MDRYYWIVDRKIDKYFLFKKRKFKLGLEPSVGDNQWFVRKYITCINYFIEFTLQFKIMKSYVLNILGK